MQGFNSQETRWWRDDYIVGRGVLARPSGGNFRILMDAGLGELDGGQGLCLTPLLEVVAGKGKALFCSMLVEEKATAEPGAALLLARCLDYLNTDGAELKPAVAWGVDLSRVHAQVLPADSPLDPRTVAAVVVNGSEPLPAERARELVAYVQAGGQAVVHRVTPESAAAIGQALGIDLQAKPTMTRWLAFRPDDPAFWGMSHYDVHWTWSGGLGRFLEKGQITDVELSSSSPQVKAYADPGAILIASLGRGKVIFDQVLWDRPAVGAYVQARADEYLAQLLTNLGVKLTPPRVSSGKISEWLILGPFRLPVNVRGSQKDFNLPDEANLVAKAGDTYQGKQWQPGKLEVRAGARNNLNGYFGTPDWTKPSWDYYVAYAQAYIISEQAQDVMLCGGADDTLKMYLNGQLLDTQEELANLRSDEDVQIKVHLNQGKNRLLVKCANWLGAWGFVVKVKDAQYPVEFAIE
jgi:hypothetical protein